MIGVIRLTIATNFTVNLWSAASGCRCLFRFEHYHGTAIGEHSARSVLVEWLCGMLRVVIVVAAKRSKIVHSWQHILIAIIVKTSN